jgi:hypothetical protein
MTHLKFREYLVRDLVVLSHEENTEIRLGVKVFTALAGQRKRAAVVVYAK